MGRRELGWLSWALVKFWRLRRLQIRPGPIVASGSKTLGGPSQIDCVYRGRERGRSTEGPAKWPSFSFEKSIKVLKSPQES